MPAIFWLYPIFFRSSAERRQDPRAVHDLRGPAQRKGRLHGKIFARCIPRRLLAALFGCMARISCRSRLVLDAWRRYAAGNWRFSRPMPLRERMKRKSRHGPPPGNASRHNLATTGPPKTHRGEILPWPTARKRIAARSCHCRTPGERISRASCHRRAPEKGTAAKYCHGRQPGDAFRRNIATTCRSGTHHGGMLPRQGVPGICGRDMLPLPVRAALARCRDEGAGGARGTIDPPPPRAGHLRCARPRCTRRSVSGKWGHCAACAVPCASWRSHRRGMEPFSAPSSQGRASLFSGLIARNGFESALFRWATMSPFRVLRSSAVSCAEAKCALTFMLGAANVVKGMSWAFARQWEIWQAR